MRTYRIESVDGATLRLHGPNGRVMWNRPLTGVRELIEAVENAYGGYTPDHDALGCRLYAWLDGLSTGWLERVRAGGRGVALSVDVAEGLRHLPWELMHRNGELLCADPARPFTPVRRVLPRSRAAGPRRRPLRVLFMACSPEHLSPLDFEGEEGAILRATRDQPTEVVVEESGTLDGLRERIGWHPNGWFDVFHLSGHATADHGEPRFLMEDELGFSYAASAREIAEAFGGAWPRLVFLSGCSTGEAPARGALPSLAEELVRAGAPAVLGWALPVFDTQASLTAARLYARLGAGERVDEAVAQVRAGLRQSGSGVWHLLRLYADASPLAPIVTHPGRWPVRPAPRPEATAEFLDAGQVEVCPRERFVGRRRMIQRCLRALRAPPASGAGAAGLVLHGMGGLGKTSLAAHLCDRMLDHRRVVVAGELGEAGFVRAFGARIGAPDDGATLSRLHDPAVPLRARLEPLLRPRGGAAPYVFVFDDFERNLRETGAGHAPTREARRVLLALVGAIHATRSHSRVIVCTRHTFGLRGAARLHHEGLESLRDAELEKKVAQLPGFRVVPDAVADRAVELAAGNPRLLDRFDAVLATPPAEAEALLDGLEEVAAGLREELLLERLLAGRGPGFRRFVALASVYRLPVARDEVAAAGGERAAAAHLDAAVSLSLVDRGRDPAGGRPRYFVSRLLHPLARRRVGPAVLRAARARGAASLHRGWREGRIPAREPVILELHRLALASGSAAIAADAADWLALWWIARSRYHDTVWLAESTLAVSEDPRTLHHLGRAERLLGRMDGARAHYRQALARCDDAAPEIRLSLRASILHNLAELTDHQGDADGALELFGQVLATSDRIGDAQGRAAALHQVAVIHERRGETDRALDLYRESLAIAERIGDLQGAATTVHQAASILALQGDVPGALELYRASLQVKAREGDARGEAATLHQLAGLHAQRGEMRRAFRLYRTALALQREIGDAGDEAATLHQIAALHAGRGRVKKALELYRQVLTLQRELGNLQGEASTLHQIADLHERMGDVARAFGLYRQSVALAERAGSAATRAAGLHQLAVMHGERGEHGVALELFARSLAFKERSGDVRGKAVTLHNMAFLHAQRGEVERAREEYRHALALLEQVGDVHGKAAALQQAASTELRQGEVDRAVALYGEALALAEAAGDVETRAQALHNLASIHADRGEHERAMKLYGQALALLDRAGVVQGKSAVLHQMAALHHDRGEVRRAEELYGEALRLARQTGNARGVAASLHQVAGMHAERGELDRAVAMYGQALAISRRSGDLRSQATTLHQLGIVHARRGDTRRALGLFRRSLALKERTGDVAGKAATLHETAAVHAGRGRVQRALALYHESLALDDGIGNAAGVAATLDAMAVLHARQGDPRRALDFHRQALAARERSGDLRGSEATLYAMAQLHAGLGDDARALELFLASLELAGSAAEAGTAAAILYQVAETRARRGERRAALDAFGSFLELTRRSDGQPAGGPLPAGEADAPIADDEAAQLRGRALALCRFGDLHRDEGEAERALELYGEALATCRRIGDRRGEGVALAQIGGVLHEQGDAAGAAARLREAASCFAGIRSWPDLALALSNLAAVDPAGETAHLAQAAWLAARAGLPPSRLVGVCEDLLEVLGPGAEPLPAIAGGTLVLVVQRTEGTPDAEALRDQALALLAACAEARGIGGQPAFLEWLQAGRLVDADSAPARMLRALEALVPGNEWRFDRGQVDAVTA